MTLRAACGGDRRRHGRRPARPAARRPAHDVDLTVIGEEPHAPYNRVLLAEVLAGRYAPEITALPGAGAGGCAPYAPCASTGRSAASSATTERAVAYDTLVLATGANPVLPPLRGLFTPGGDELPDGVRAFRTMDDCLALARGRNAGTRAVVIGGGLLGVSAARALAQRGAQVVLAHQGERLMERHLDDGAAELLRRHLEEPGVEVHTECRVADCAHSVRAAVRRDRQRRPPRRRTRRRPPLDADLVVLACGVRPRVGLAGPPVWRSRASSSTTGCARATRRCTRSATARSTPGSCTDSRARRRSRRTSSPVSLDRQPREAARRPPRYRGTRCAHPLTLPSAPAATPARPRRVRRADAARRTTTSSAWPTPPAAPTARSSSATTGSSAASSWATSRAVGTLARTWEGDEALPSAATAPPAHPRRGFLMTRPRRRSC